MITTTLSSDKSRNFGFYKDTLRRLRSFVLFYGAVGFVFFPLQYLMGVLRDREYYFMGLGDVFNAISMVFYGPFLCVVPVIVATQIFGYMHSKKAVDLYHALPIRREELLLSSFAAGFTAILGPLALNYAVVALLKVAGGQEIGNVVISFLYAAVISFAALAIAAFVFTQVGTKFDSIVITLGMYVILPALYMVTMLFMSEHLYGFNVDQSINWKLLLGLSPQLLFYYLYAGGYPISSYSNMPTLASGHVTAFVWLIIGIFLALVSAVIYRRRKSEMAENTSTGGILKVFIKIASTYLASLLMGFIFEGVFGVGSDDFGMFLLGVVLGAVLTYLTAEVILSRSFKAIFKSLPMAAGLAAVLCAFSFVMYQGGLGYVTRVPQAEDVASVTIEYRGAYGENERQGITGRYIHDVTLEGEKAKALITQLHRLAVEEYQQYKGEVPEDSRYYRSYTYVNITYKMEGGSTINRSYSSKNQEFLECLARLEANQEFISKTHPVFRTQYKDLEKITLTGASGVGSVPLNLSEEETNQLLACMQEDLLARTYDQVVNGKPAIGFLSMNYKFDNRYNEYYSPDHSSRNQQSEYPEENFFMGSQLTLTEDFTNTVAFLKEKGYGSMLELQEGEVVGLVFRHPMYDGYDSGAISLVQDYDFNSYNSGNQTWKEEKGYVVYRGGSELVGEILPKLHSSTINGYRCVRVDYVVNENLSANGAMEFPGGSVSNQGAYGYLAVDDLPEDVQKELAKITPEGIEYDETVYPQVAVATESL